ncbi:hypothetical protein RIN66_04105 [Hafnia alvei]|uniref:hypothetical protein n=1 Tax=Hafnia alvei TaxID=569 RepID=UPI0028BD3B4B|nr:hypothetical protein [Hafnia alvei]WNN53254.1 hypothetical protein RIN66_04105 [Hafnia alvei]
MQRINLAVGWRSGIFWCSTGFIVCVTFPLCAVKGTHWLWRSVLNIAGWCSFTATRQQMPFGNAGRSP